MADNKLFPMLTEQGNKEATEFMNDLKEKIVKIVNETISDIYVGDLTYIESDSWENFRNDLMAGLKDYPNSKIHEKYNFKAVRKQILKEHKEEIIKDINQDLLEEINRLKEHVKLLQKMRSCQETKGG